MPSPSESTASFKPRIAFFGTPSFAAYHLEGLLQAGYRPDLVITQPDRPAKRGKKLTPPPVKEVAEAAGLTVWQPERPRQRAFVDQYARELLHLAIVVGYGEILAKRMLESPFQGSINVHASLLPRWRGAAPIEHAILAGDTRTGISIQRMVPALDEGPVLATVDCRITDSTTRGVLHDTLATLGTKLLLETIPKILGHAAAEEPQSTEGICYAGKLSNADGVLDLSRPARALARQVNALNPNPGTWIGVGFEDDRPPARLKLLAAQPLAAGPPRPCGKILPQSDGMPQDSFIAAVGPEGRDRLYVTVVQPPGRTPMEGDAFRRGYPVSRLVPAPHLKG